MCTGYGEETVTVIRVTGSVHGMGQDGGGGALGRRNSCPYYTEHAHVVNAFVSPTKHQLLVAHTPQGRPETNCEVVNSMQSTTGPHTQ